MAKYFLTLEVLGTIGWPNRAFSQSYCGRELKLRPESLEHAPSVIVERLEGETIEQARHFVTRFLSALSWATGEETDVGLGVGGTHVPASVGASKKTRCIRECNFDCAPETSTAQQALALAIYREALFVNVPAFQLLGFCRIMNLVVGRSGSEQIKWMNRVIPKLIDQRVQDSVSAVAAIHGDIGNYLHVACRCAIAHASITETTIDPDDVLHRRRIIDALPIAKRPCVIRQPSGERGGRCGRAMP